MGVGVDRARVSPAPSGPNQWPPEGEWQPLPGLGPRLVPPFRVQPLRLPGVHGQRVAPSRVPELKPVLLASTVPSTPPFTPSRPSLGEGGQGGCAGRGQPAVEPLTPDALHVPQKSCTCHPGPPACPAPSPRSTPWRSCAPTSGRGPVPSPSASRSPPPSLPAQGAPPAWWAEIGREAPLQEAPKTEPLTLLPGVPLA